MNHRDLEVWKQGRELALFVYRATASFPVDEKFGLTSQMRRAATSIPANIAEGAGRQSDAELIRFVRIALGSMAELDTFLDLSAELGFLPPEDLIFGEKRIRDLGVKLRNFIAAVERRRVREPFASYDPLSDETRNLRELPEDDRQPTVPQL